MRISFKALAITSLLALPASASAGVYGDDLGKCLVSASTEADKMVLVKWMFSAMAANPVLAPLATVSPETRKTYDQDMAKLAQRLILEDCRDKAVIALKNEGPAIFGTSFQILGTAAGQSIMEDPRTLSAGAAFAGYLDNAKIQAFAREAGTPLQAAAPAK
jgi:hypothetical protein